MNDDLEYHTESDEGVNQGNINFDGNEQLVFKKRGFGESSNMKKQINTRSNQKNKIVQHDDGLDKLGFGN